MAYYYTSDQVGSVREMIDSSGSTVSRLSYDPYGNTTVVSGTNLPIKQYKTLYNFESNVQFAANILYSSSTGTLLNYPGGRGRGGPANNDPVSIPGGFLPPASPAPSPYLDSQPPPSGGGSGVTCQNQPHSLPPIVQSFVEDAGNNLKKAAEGVAAGAGLALLGPGEVALVEDGGALGLGGDAAEGGTTTVGRWMSQDELTAMQNEGRVQESFNNGVTSVTLPPNPSAYAAAPKGDIYTEFDVPNSAINAADGTTAKIYGPNSIFGPKLNITEMPPASNIRTP